MPIKNLYQAGQWTFPGGIFAVALSGRTADIISSNRKIEFKPLMWWAILDLNQ